MIKRFVATLILAGSSFAFAGSRPVPPRVRDFVAERVEIEGTLEMMIEDRYDGSRQLSYLDTDSGERYSLKFATPPTRFQTGERVIVTGFRTETSIAVDSEDSGIRRVSSGVTTSGIQATSAISTAFGAQRTVVILVNFTDKATQPYTVAAARDTVFTTVNNFDLENSYGQTWLTGDVFGWYTIAQSATVCDGRHVGQPGQVGGCGGRSEPGKLQPLRLRFPRQRLRLVGTGHGRRRPLHGLDQRGVSSSRSSPTRWGTTSASTTHTPSIAAPFRWARAAR